jgi:hypothetical protein
MGRPRVGHGWTSARGKSYFANDDGQWVPTGVACGWKRCVRCRRPIQREFGAGMCNTCYYYKTLTVEEFWGLKNEFYFPYNIGARMLTMHFAVPPPSEETGKP